MKLTTKKITTTAILLALCIAMQCLKGVSVYITGPFVNATIILGAWAAGWFGGLSIALISPLVAFALGMTPVLNFMPQMILVIMAGNALMAVAAKIIENKGNLLEPLGLIVGSGVKALFLWLSVWYFMLPTFGTHIPEKMQTAIKTTFSLTQLITALIGSAIAWLIWLRLRRLFEKDKKGE